MIHNHNQFKVFVFFFIAVFATVNAPALAQSYDASLINKGHLFASGALLQDYDEDGDLDIVIIRKRDNELTGGIEWLENEASGQFPRHELTADLHEPGHIEAGDMDADGDIDYIVADAGSGTQPGELVLFERQDDGTYIKWTLMATEQFDQLDLADFDADGDLDVVAVGFDLDVLFVWFNEGGLNFTQTPINESVNQLRVVEAEDVDDDGDIDILTNDLLLRNNGSGEFGDVTELFTSTGIASAGRDFVVEDLNGDGTKDIITFRTVGSGGLFFLDGSNNFSYSQIDRDGIDLGGSIIVADLDDNGRMDIIRQNFGDEYVAVLYQDSEMTFRREIIEQEWDSEGQNAQFVLGDLDDDGDPDLIFPEDGNVDGDISWFENIDGSLYRHYIYSEVQAAHRTRLGDMDGDGDLDVVLAAGNDQGSAGFNEREIVWYENRGSRGFFESRIEDNIFFAADLELADLDGDEMLDVVASGELDNTLYWYKKTGLVWDRSTIEANGNLPRGVAVADVDSDGPLDVILGTAGDNKVFWYKNDGSGNFTRNVVDANLSEPFDMEAADLNADGATDVVVIASDTSNAVALYINDGSETFSREILFTGHAPTDIEIGDWSGDGAPDIIVSFRTRFVDAQNIVLFTNNGAGAFTSESIYSDNQELTLAIELADTDGDADLDIAFSFETIQPGLAIIPNEAGAPGEVILVRENNPDDFVSIDSGDIDGDGDIDLVGAGSDSDAIVLFTNTELEPVAVEGDETPSAFVLSQNYPNPFNPSTQISFNLPEASLVSLAVFDVLGRKVASLVEGTLPAGEHTVTFDAGNFPSGMYLYRLSSGAFVQTKKMILMR